MKKINNKIRKGDIKKLLSKYTIDNIESALIKIFIENKNISNVNNILIKNKITNSINYVAISNYLTERGIELDIETLVRFFELLIPEKDRKLNGAFYTPNFIVKYIVNNTIHSDVKVCDPSCGSGAFLIEAVKKIHEKTKKSYIDIIENNIFGCDILDYAVNRTKIILSLLTLLNGEDKQNIKFNIICENSLSIDWSKKFPNILNSGDWKDIFGMSENGFDVIIGNPPYVRIQDLDEINKKDLSEKWETVSNGSFNLYIAFFELGVKLLKRGGKLGYITPNNYFTSLAGISLRKYLQENKLLKKILDFNHLKIFEDSSTYTCITLLEKDKKDFFEYQVIENSNKLKLINETKFDEVIFSNLNFKKWRLLNKRDYENVKKIENINKSLKELVNIHSGIATLKDILYFIDSSQEKNGFFVKEYNGSTYKIEKEITKPIRKISSFCNEKEISNDKRRIIFPYEIKYGKAIIIPEQDLQRKYPKCYTYFLAIKEELKKRDKGAINYPIWYAYGRSQGLNKFGRKLLTPTFSNSPRFMLDENKDSLFCNGYGIFQKEHGIDLKVLKKILNSSIMDYFTKKTSVNIEGGYQCYQKNFIESFNIPNLTNDDIEFLRRETDKNKIDEFLILKYRLNPEPFNNIKTN